MKHWYRVVPALLLVALTACSSLPATQPSTPPTETPAATEEPAPISTPEPTPTPDPTEGMEYEMLTLSLTPQPPEIHDSQFMPREDTQAHRSNGYAFIEALYTNDAEKLRGALADSVLNNGLPLPDLTGLVITEVYLAGGVYEAPYAILTIADPGATGLPAGSHEFRFSFDQAGKVAGFSLVDSDLQEDTAQAMGLEPGEWVQLGSLDVSNETQEDLHLTMETRVVGRKLDALGFKVGEVRAFSVAEQYAYDDNHTRTEYAMTSCRELPGDWPTRRDRAEWYTQVPQGNCLSQEELQGVADQLNQLFARLREGTYTSQWQQDPEDAALSLWNFSHPVPVQVTPEVLRSDVRRFPNPRIWVWVPLPDQCWALCSLSEEGNLDDFLGFSFALTAPDGV